jgi:hypothetical protein
MALVAIIHLNNYKGASYMKIISELFGAQVAGGCRTDAAFGDDFVAVLTPRDYEYQPVEPTVPAVLL